MRSLRGSDVADLPHNVTSHLLVRFQQILWLTILTCTALVFSPRYAYAYSDVKYAYAAFGSLLFVSVVLRVIALRQPVGRARWYFLVLVLGLLGSAIASSAWAINQFELRKGLLFLCGCIGCGLFTAFAPDSRKVSGAMSLLVGLITILASVYGIAQWRGFDFLPLQIVEALKARYPGKYLVSTFGSGVFAAQYLSAALPLLLGAAIFFTGFRRWFGLAGFFAGSIYLFLTLSRSGFLGYIAALSIFALWAGVAFIRRNRRFLPYTIAAISLGAIALGLATYYSGMWKRFVLRPDTPQAKSASYRYYIWQDTLRMISATGGRKGVGYWNYDIALPKYASIDLLEQQPRTYANERVNRAHSDYLDYWAELGIAGFVLFTCLGAYGGIAAVRFVKQSRPLELGCAAAVVATGVHALVDFPTYNPASGTLFWSLLGMCASAMSGGESVLRITRARTIVAVIIVVTFAAALALFSWYRYLVSQTLSRDGYALVNAGRHQEALVPLRRAYTSAPQNREVFSGLTGALLRGASPAEAITATQQWVQLEPYFPSAYNTLGAALGQAGETSASLKAFYKSIELAPTNASALVNIANIWYSQGEFAMAAQYYVPAFAIDAEFAQHSIYPYVHSLAKTGQILPAADIARDYLVSKPGNQQMKELEKALRRGIVPP